MAHLNDLQKGSGVIRDYTLVESLIWARVENEVTDFELLSYGALGLYVFNLLNSPDGFSYQNGEKGKAKIQHFVLALNDSEPTNSTPYGVKTGRELPEKNATAPIKKETYGDAFRFFDRVLDSHPAMTDPSHINNWIRYWHVGLAAQLHFIDGRVLGMYRKETGLNDSKLWSHVRANVLEMTPAQLRTNFADKPAPKKTTKKTTKKPAKKAVVETGVPSLAVALEASGNSK